MARSNKEILAMLLGQKKKKKGLFATPPTALEYKELYKTDPRLLYGRGLMKSAAGRTPKNVGEGISKAADAIFGALAMREGLEDVREKEKIAKEKLLEERTKSLEQIKSANLASLGLPEWKDPDTEKILIPASKGRPASIEQLRSYGDELTLAGQAYLGNLVQEERKQKDQFSKIKFESELKGKLEDRKQANRLELANLKNALNLSKEQSNAATKYYYDEKMRGNKSEDAINQEMLTKFGIKISKNPETGATEYTPIKEIQKFINKKNAKLKWIPDPNTKELVAYEWNNGILKKVTGEDGKDVRQPSDEDRFTYKQNKDGKWIETNTRTNQKKMVELSSEKWSKPFKKGNKFVQYNLSTNKYKDVANIVVKHGTPYYDQRGNYVQDNLLTDKRTILRAGERQSDFLSKALQEELIVSGKKMVNGKYSNDDLNAARAKIHTRNQKLENAKSMRVNTKEQLLAMGVKPGEATKEQINEAIDKVTDRQYRLNLSIGAGKKTLENKFAVQGAINIVRRLKKLSQGIFPKAKGLKGIVTRVEKGVSKKFMNWLQDRPDWVVYDRITKATLSRMVRALGEKGVLTQQDVERIEKAYPKTGWIVDSRETAEKLFDELERLVRNGVEQKGYIISKDGSVSTSIENKSGESAVNRRWGK